MNRISKIALIGAIAIASAPGVAGAFSECPANAGVDGYTCTQLTGAGKNGGYFRVTFPSDWDGDLVIVNHGFDLEDKKIRPHETCSNDSSQHCESDAECDMGAFCNNISYLGVDEVLLPKGKAVAAGTYSQSGWAVFGSAKDLKDIISFVRKHDTYGDQLRRVIVTGFSLGGAVTGDATLKLKIDGAVPLCAAVGGGLPTWDVAQDVRMVYDFLCDDVPNASFPSFPDQGEPQSMDQVTMALRVNTCFGILSGMPTPEQTARLDDFYALTDFSSSGVDVAVAMGFATLGLGDFVRDENRLKGKRIGLNDTLDYSDIGDGGALAADLEANIERLTKGPGRSKLKKASWPDFVKGKGAKVDYPILSMAGAADWLVIPEFQRVYTTALAAGSKAYTQTWIDTFGHCVFTEQEVTAVFNEYFDWIGNTADDAMDTQPTAVDVRLACEGLGGGPGSCNFNDAFVPGYIYERIPPRPDWPAAALPSMP